MQKRALGNTGLEVTMLGYGAIKLPNISEREASECLNRALDLGVNLIDSAHIYGDSEEKIGKAVSHRRDEFYLATKTEGRDAATFESELDESLRKLQTDYLDIYQLHTVSTWDVWQAVQAPGGAYEAAVNAKKAGKIRHIGVSIHRDKRVMKSVIESGLFETIMLCYNPIDSEDVGTEILPMARKAGMGTIIMKALSGGQLVQPAESRVSGLGGPDAVVAGALRFVMQNPCVDVVIAGMQKLHEVEENVAVAENFTPLSEQEHDELVRMIGKLSPELRYGQVCLRCGYCRPCTVGIDIPEVLKAADMKRAYADELHAMAEEAWRNLEVSPEECTECGACMERCPAGLDIPDLLRQATDLFAPIA